MKNYTKDYYKILNITYPSCLDEIKTAYRNLSKRYHPDMGGDALKMYEINEAYSILSDNIKKSDYDHWYYQNNMTVLAHILDEETGYYSEENIVISDIVGDYNKYKDNKGEIYILIERNNKRRVMVSQNKWVECLARLHNPQKEQYVQAYVYDREVGIYIKQFSIEQLPKNYLKYQDDDGTVYLYRDYSKANNPFIIVYPKQWGVITHNDRDDYKVAKQPRKSQSIISIIGKFYPLLLFVLFIALICVSTISYEDNAASNDAEPILQKEFKETSATPSPTPTVAPVPQNGEMIKEPYSERVAPLTIKTTDREIDYYIYMKNTVNSNNDISFFVYGGTDVDIYVPLGKYKLFYCTGDRWYGVQGKFGSETKYYTSDEVLNFWEDKYYINGHTIELYKQINGNFSTKDIRPFEFPN